MPIFRTKRKSYIAFEGQLCQQHIAVHLLIKYTLNYKVLGYFLQKHKSHLSIESLALKIIDPF